MADTRLAVIGAGTGGYAAAFLGADLGMDVTLIAREPQPGGVCLQTGCIPSKALLHAAKVIEESRHAANIGITFGEPAIDLARMLEWKNSVVARMTGGLAELVKRRKVRYIHGRARFENARRLSVTPEGGSPESLDVDYVVVGTGSFPATLPGFPDSPRIWNSTEALELPEVPERLLVVGGGYIGLELGSVYSALGSVVTVVEVLDSLLPGVDADLVRPLSRKLAKSFAAIRVRTKVTEVHDREDGLRVVMDKEGERIEESFDRILVSVGRRPRSEGLGLETTAVEIDEKGFIKVDAQRRTAEPTIFAVGDVTGEPMLAHKATHEGRTAVEAIHGEPVAFEPRAIPAIVFTDPEIAWAGVTETEAKEQGLNFKVSKFPWAASGRAVTLDRFDGVTKILVDPETERILGIGICGPGAGELIAEGVLAIEMAATVKDLELSIHPHPTLSETVMEAASVFFGTSPHYFSPRRK